MSAIATTGCGGGSVIVAYAVNAEVSLRDSHGKTQEPGVIVTVPRDPRLRFPFDEVQYRGQDFEWTFGTNTHGMSGGIANRSAEPLCLRFDQAQIRSNFHPAPTVLRTFAWRTIQEKWSILGSTDPKQRQYFGPPAFCLEPGKAARVSFAPDLGPLFPTQKMFNVSWPDNEPQLTDKGVGNWIALSVPVEIGEKRQVMDVKLTAIDSKAFISYH